MPRVPTNSSAYIIAGANRKSVANNGQRRHRVTGSTDTPPLDQDPESVAIIDPRYILSSAGQALAMSYDVKRFLPFGIGHAPDPAIRLTRLQIVPNATSLPFHRLAGSPFPNPAVGRSEPMHQNRLAPSLSGEPQASATFPMTHRAVSGRRNKDWPTSLYKCLSPVSSSSSASAKEPPSRSLPNPPASSLPTLSASSLPHSWPCSSHEISLRATSGILEPHRAQVSLALFSLHSATDSSTSCFKRAQVASFAQKRVRPMN